MLDVPLLHLVKSNEKWDRNKDDNGLSAMADLNLKRVLVSALGCPVPTASS